MTKEEFKDKVESFKYAIKPAFMFRLEDKWFDFKMKCQRFKKGYADIDVWNLSYWFETTVPKMLAELNKTRHGYPADLTDKKWEKILTQMIKYFESSTEEWIDTEYEKRCPDTKFFSFIDVDEDGNTFVNCGPWISDESLSQGERVNRQNFDIGLYHKIYKEAEANRHKAFKLFEKYFRNLWD